MADHGGGMLAAAGIERRNARGRGMWVRFVPPAAPWLTGAVPAGSGSTCRHAWRRPDRFSLPPPRALPVRRDSGNGRQTASARRPEPSPSATRRRSRRMRPAERSDCGSSDRGWLGGGRTQQDFRGFQIFGRVFQPLLGFFTPPWDWHHRPIAPLEWRGPESTSTSASGPQTCFFASAQYPRRQECR